MQEVGAYKEIFREIYKQKNTHQKKEGETG